MATKQSATNADGQYPEIPADSRELADVRGIGPKTAEKIQALGFETFDHAAMAYLYSPEEIVGQLPARAEGILIREMVADGERVAMQAGVSPPVVAIMAFIREFGANRMVLKDEYRFPETKEYVNEKFGEGVRRDKVAVEHVDWEYYRENESSIVACPANVMGVLPISVIPGDAMALTNAAEFDQVYADDVFGTLTSDQGVEMCFDVERLASLCEFAGLTFDPSGDSEDDVEKILMVDKAELDALEMEYYPLVIPIPSANARVALAPALND